MQVINNGPNPTKGLINRPGENNCFVNSVIQLLWHTSSFRRNFLRINFHTTCNELVRMKEEAKLMEIPVLSEPVEKAHEEVVEKKNSLADPIEFEPKEDEPVLASSATASGSSRCIVCALQNLFIMFQYSEESSIPPTVVRKVMSDVFAEGEMHSALDCFEFLISKLKEKNLYSIKRSTLELAEKLGYNGDEETLDLSEGDRESFLEDLEERKVNLIESVFCHSFVEIKKCSCRATSEPFVSKTTFIHLAVNDIVSIAQKDIRRMKEKNLFYNIIDPKAHFSSIVHACLNSGNFDCPERGAECKWNNVTQENSLIEIPKTFCLTFNWISEFTSREIIQNVTQAIRPELDLTKMFSFYPDIKGQDKSSSMYYLSAAIAYYGRHYTVYVYHNGRHEWVYCDDSRIRVIGNWKKVVSNVIKCKHQLEFLAYSSKKPDFIKKFD